MNLSNETSDTIKWKQDELLYLLNEADLGDPEVWHDLATLAKEIEELLISLG